MVKKNLPRIMQSRGITPESLAVRMQASGASVTAGTVRSWMAGYRIPSFRNAQAIATALECTIDDLVIDAARE